MVNHPEAPILAFAKDLDANLGFIGQGADTEQLLSIVVRNLSAKPTDFTVLDGGVACCGGRDHSAERVVDPVFLRALHDKGGRDLLIGIPHTKALYAIASSANQPARRSFATMLEFELDRCSDINETPITDMVLRVSDGRIVTAFSLDEFIV